ncbi:MAG: DUF4062 domain-containing protein [Campylobacterota bacterium]|nr:DUF4062 domain-containing protein [Campylobacterota bacterium]
MQSKTFRLFISSTFSDFTNEREVLHKKVFPKIDKYCIENGFSFQPIDLRWGVSNEAQLDQKTLEVCLEEVRACKHFPHPNFLIMAGDRYGYVPCPYMIEKEEFEKIKETTSKEELKTLEYWYKLDENQIYITNENKESTAYILQPRTDEYIDYPNWEKEENLLRDILQNGADKIFDNKENKEYQKYFISATEAEVIEGILDYKDLTSTQKNLIEKEDKLDEKFDKEFVYGYTRTIKDASGLYIDHKEELKDKVDKFKENISNTLDKSNNILYTNFNSISEYERNELEEFKNFIYNKLIKSIDAQKQSQQAIPKLEQEIQEQQKFQHDKLKGFQGRVNTLQRIDTYITSTESNLPLIIYGPSGMGKSSLMAKAIEDTKLKADDIIYRFIGVTQNSTTIRNILTSITDQLAKKDIIENIESYEEDDNKFFEQIKNTLQSIEKTTIIFIDALDQLQHKEYLMWLPEILPNNLKIVLSVLNDSDYEKDTHYYNTLRQRYNSDENFINIIQDSLESTKELLIENLLKSLDRKLNTYQTDDLLDRWSEANYSPLYLKIAIEEVKHWRSEDTTQKLESGVQGIILKYIKNLTSLYHHEELLVKKVFGYIHASKDGLSEKELLEILSEDLENEEEFQKRIINEWHEPIKVKNTRNDNKEELVLPMSIWSRLHTVIKPFIVERNIDNQPLMKFFHRQFTSVIDSYTKNIKIDLHSKLSEYFYSLQDKTKLWNKRYQNLHMLDELPFQLFHSKNSEQLKEILFDLEFAGAIYDNNKQDEYKEVITQASTLNNISEDEIYPWESFYREKEHLITRIDEELWRPHQSLFQLAYEDGLDSPINEKADELLEKDRINFIWLKRKNKDKNYQRTGLINSLNNHINSIDNVKILANDKIAIYYKNSTIGIFNENLVRLSVADTNKILDEEVVVRESQVSKEYEISSMIIGLPVGNLKVKEFLNGLKITYDEHSDIQVWTESWEFLAIFSDTYSKIKYIEVLKNGNILTFSDNNLMIWNPKGFKNVSLTPSLIAFTSNMHFDMEQISDEALDLPIVFPPSNWKTRHIDTDYENKSLFISYSLEKANELLKNHSNNTQDKEASLDTLIYELFTTNFLEIIIDSNIGTVIIYKIINEKNISYFSHLSNESKELTMIYDFFINCKRNEISIDTIGKDKKYKALQIISEEYATFKEINGLVDISDIEHIIYHNWDDQQLTSYRDIYIDNEYNTNLMKSQLQHKIYTKICGLSNIKIIQSLHSDVEATFVEPSTGKVIYTRDEEIVTSLKICKMLMFHGVESDDIVIVTSDINTYSPLYIKYLDNSYMKGFVRQGIPLNLYSRTNIHSNNAYKEFDHKIEKIQYLCEKLNLKLTNEMKNNIKSTVFVQNERVGMELVDLKNFSGVGRQYKHVIFIGTDPELFPNKNTPNFLYTEDEDRKYFMRETSFNIAKKNFDELKRKADNIYILTAQNEWKQNEVENINILNEDSILVSHSLKTKMQILDNYGNVLNVLDGHTEGINGIKIFNDGRILSYSSDKSLIIWSNKGDLIHVLTGHEFEIKSAEILDDNTIVSTDCYTIKLWSEKGNVIKSIACTCRRSYSYMISVLENNIIYVNSDILQIFNTDGDLLKLLDDNKYKFEKIEVLGNKKFATWSSSSKSIQIWSYIGALEYELIENQAICYVREFNNSLLIGFTDGTLVKWSYQDNMVEKIKAHTEWIRGISIISNKIMTYSFDNTIKIWSNDFKLEKILYIPSITRFHSVESELITSRNYGDLHLYEYNNGNNQANLSDITIR